MIQVEEQHVGTVIEQMSQRKCAPDNHNHAQAHASAKSLIQSSRYFVLRSAKKPPPTTSLRTSGSAFRSRWQEALLLRARCARRALAAADEAERRRH
eukprot:563209-Prorocentrum_minimum.AAC.2